jgi:hypothetical protein
MRAVGALPVRTVPGRGRGLLSTRRLIHRSVARFDEALLRFNAWRQEKARVRRKPEIEVRN